MRKAGDYIMKRHRHVSGPAAAAAFVLLFPSLAFSAAQAQSVALSGRVISASGQPVAGAEVMIQAGQGDPSTVVSDATGRFEIAALESGEYRISARALGFSPVTERVTISKSQPIELILLLPEIVRERVNVVGDASLVDKIPGSATVIDRREMEKARIATDDIHQMLRQVPGLNIQEEEGYGLRPNIGMRGTGTDRNSKITMMEDGVLVAPAPYAAPAAYYSPTAGRMESLEVRKGSSQVKYGPITTGGVLNYISTSIPSTFQLRGTVAGGGDSTRKITAAVGDSSRHLGWLVETFQFRNDGFKQLDGGGDTGVDLADYLAKLRINTGPTARLYQEIELKIGRTEQTGDETYLGLTDADFQINPVRRYAASQVDVLDATHEQYQVRHFLARPTWDLTTVVYRNNFHRAWYKLESVLGSGLTGVLRSPTLNAERLAVLTGADSAPNALIVRNNNRTYFGAGVQSILGVSGSSGPLRHQMELGVRYHRDEEDRFQQDDGYQMLGGRMILTRKGAPGSQANQIVGATAVAGFVSDTMTWGKWSASPGLRYESIDLEQTTYARTDPTRSGSATVVPTEVSTFIPGIGLSYEARPGASVFGGVHKGFAPPGPGAVEGTEVEHSVNYEFGTRLQRAGARTDVVGFFNDYGNLLGRDTLSTGGTGEGRLFNGGKARVYGLEASAQWNPAAALGLASALPLRLTYTFTHAEFRNSFQSQFGPWGNVQVGDDLPYVPRHQVYASVETDHQAWRARLEGFYVGRMRTRAGQGPYVVTDSTDSYFVVNVSGEYRLGGGASLFASVQNLANNAYIVARHPAGVRPGLPRLVQAGLKIALGR
ncbi:MAG: TonB-dependent receptor [Acidobacteria bacterium]|nr:TonB-dependent receptor [Acidobacteriota bacterium]